MDELKNDINTWDERNYLSMVGNPVVKDINRYWKSNSGQKKVTANDILDDLAAITNPENDEKKAILALFEAAYALYAGKLDKQGYRFGHSFAPKGVRGKIADFLTHGCSLAIFSVSALDLKKRFEDLFKVSDEQNDNVKVHLNHCRHAVLDKLYMLKSPEQQGVTIDQFVDFKKHHVEGQDPFLRTNLDSFDYKVGGEGIDNNEIRETAEHLNKYAEFLSVLPDNISDAWKTKILKMMPHELNDRLEDILSKRSAVDQKNIIGAIVNNAAPDRGLKVAYEPYGILGHSGLENMLTNDLIAFINAFKTFEFMDKNQGSFVGEFMRDHLRMDDRKNVLNIEKILAKFDQKDNEELAKKAKRVLWDNETIDDVLVVLDSIIRNKEKPIVSEHVAIIFQGVKNISGIDKAKILDSLAHLKPEDSFELATFINHNIFHNDKQKIESLIKLIDYIKTSKTKISDLSKQFKKYTALDDVLAAFDPKALKTRLFLMGKRGIALELNEEDYAKVKAVDPAVNGRAGLVEFYGDLFDTLDDSEKKNADGIVAVAKALKECVDKVPGIFRNADVLLERTHPNMTSKDMVNAINQFVNDHLKKEAEKTDEERKEDEQREQKRLQKEKEALEDKKEEFKPAVDKLLIKGDGAEKHRQSIEEALLAYDDEKDAERVAQFIKNYLTDDEKKKTDDIANIIKTFNHKESESIIEFLSKIFERGKETADRVQALGTTLTSLDFAKILDHDLESFVTFIKLNLDNASKKDTAALSDLIQGVKTVLEDRFNEDLKTKIKKILKKLNKKDSKYSCGEIKNAILEAATQDD